jgi:hypothetical protein
MKTTKVSVSYGRTINMGNYESLRLEYSAEAEIDDDLTIGDAFTALRHSLRFEVNEGVGKEMYFLQGGDKPRRKG